MSAVVIVAGAIAALGMAFQVIDAIATIRADRRSRKRVWHALDQRTRAEDAAGRTP